jgi:hypothetical protein
MSHARPTRWQSALIIFTLVLGILTVRTLVFAPRVFACGSFHFDHANSTGIGVYDYSQQKYTTIWFSDNTYTDGCADYEWLSMINVEDGTHAELTPFITWWYPNGGNCGSVQQTLYGQATASLVGQWSYVAYEYSPVQGNCGSHDSDTYGSSAYSAAFSPSAVWATVYS